MLTNASLVSGRKLCPPLPYLPQVSGCSPLYPARTDLQLEKIRGSVFALSQLYGPPLPPILPSIPSSVVFGTLDSDIVCDSPFKAFSFSFHGLAGPSSLEWEPVSVIILLTYSPPSPGRGNSCLKQVFPPEETGKIIHP